MQEFEFIGEWWLPDSEHKIIGTINGIFKPHEDEIRIILGRISENRFVTLWKCLWVSSSGMGASIQGRYYAHIVFIGCLFNKEEDIKFSSLFVEFTHFQEWLGKSGFLFNPENMPKSDITLIYNFPEEINIVYKNLIISIKHKLSNIEKKYKAEFTLKQTDYIEIKSNNEISYDELIKILHYLRHFISFGVGKPIFPLEVIGLNTNDLVEKSPSLTFKHPTQIDIFYELRGFEKEIKEISVYSMFFGYHRIGKNFKEYLKLWLEKNEKVEKIYNLFFNLQYLTSTYTNLTFLTLAQVIEAYHRELYNLKDMTLKNRFRAILKDILTPYRDMVLSLVGDEELFLQGWVKLRNYFTHYGDNFREDLFSRDEIYVINEVTKFLIRFCFFIELGFSKDIVDEIIKDNNAFKQISKKDKWWLYYKP